MKKTFSTAFYFLLCAVLVVFGVFFGAYRGWHSEAKRVEAIYNQPNGLNTMLIYCANDGANLEKVALRHLSKDDALLKALKEYRAGAADEKATLHARFLANESLNDTASALAQTLLALPSVQASQRDTGYIHSILRDMENLVGSGAIDEYNLAARDMNQRLNRSLSGGVAKLLFVKPAPVFE